MLKQRELDGVSGSESERGKIVKTEMSHVQARTREAEFAGVIRNVTHEKIAEASERFLA